MITQAQFENLFNLGAGAMTGGTFPFFQRGDLVWRKSDFTGKSTWRNLNHTVLDWHTKTFNDGLERFADSTLVNEVSNANSPSVPPGDETSGWFYILQNNNTKKITQNTHESDLLGASPMEAYLATQLGNFIE